MGQGRQGGGLSIHIHRILKSNQLESKVKEKAITCVLFPEVVPALKLQVSPRLCQVDIMGDQGRLGIN